jgi:glycosyltransferase involved in cell wall biosynthesis
LEIQGFEPMSSKAITRVIIPALNEENSIGKVVGEIPRHLVREVIVIDNGSTDMTMVRAGQAGATVLTESRRGYGYACLKGIEYIRTLKERTQIVVFVDGDYSDYPEEMPGILEPLLQNEADLVIGSRMTGKRQKGSMTLPQVFGNWLATRLIKSIFGVAFTDLGPFRAISFDRLMQLQMEDKTYGWTVEMQIKAAKAGLRCTEVPVGYRKRIGKSKVSGTIRGVFMAGYKILWTIFNYR